MSYYSRPAQAGMENHGKPWKQEEIEQLLNEIKDNNDISENEIVIDKTINPDTIDKMSKKEREELLNQLIENGVENLTENDKKILPLLAK